MKNLSSFALVVLFTIPAFAAESSFPETCAAIVNRSGQITYTVSIPTDSQTLTKSGWKQYLETKRISLVANASALFKFRYASKFQISADSDATSTNLFFSADPKAHISIESSFPGNIEIDGNSFELVNRYMVLIEPCSSFGSPWAIDDDLLTNAQ